MARALILLLLLATPAWALSESVTQLTISVAKEAGLDPAFLLAVVDIESSGNCSAQTGQYKGLLQLSSSQFRGSNIFDCRENLRAGAKILADAADTFQAANGRDPSAIELYLIHQQGTEGQRAHANHLDLPAWKSLWLHTAEGVNRGMGWSQLAIWGNVPSDVRSRYGRVENVTSAAFVQIWREKLEARMRRLLPSPPPAAVEAYQCFIPAALLDKLRRE